MLIKVSLLFAYTLTFNLESSYCHHRSQEKKKKWYLEEKNWTERKNGKVKKSQIFEISYFSTVLWKMKCRDSNYVFLSLHNFMNNA